MSDSPNRATLRQKTRSAWSHRRAADTALEAIQATQEALNSALAKLDADAAGTLDTDYNTLKITSLFEADEPKLPAQNKATLRKALRSALSHRKLADEIVDSVEEMQAAFNAWMDKLDAEAGTLDDTDYADTLGLTVIDADSEGTEAQHKASLRKSLRSAMANKRAADQIMDAISGMQAAMNSSLAALDAGDVNGEHAGFAVTAIDPDAE